MSVCQPTRRLWEFLKYLNVLPDVMNSGGTRYVPGKHRAEQAMNTIVLERLNTGDVIEMTTVDNDVTYVCRVIGHRLTQPQ